MKAFIRYATLIAVCLSVLISAGALSGFITEAGAADEYAVGDTFEFGSYPQSKVTQSDIIDALDGAEKNWVSFGFKSGDGAIGSAAASDYMMYADIEYEGETYRAVKIDSYRPRSVISPTGTSASTGYQDDNGYCYSNTYYFKFEPIVWKVLDSETGFCLSEKIIFTDAFCDEIYENGTDKFGTAYYGDSSFSSKANRYSASSLREKLNGEFYETAFDEDEQSRITLTEAENKSYQSAYSLYSGSNTDEKVFLLSYDEAVNESYGFYSGAGETSTRTAQGTDYAKCLGLLVDESGYSSYLLRSAGNMSRNCAFADHTGFINTGAVDRADKGIRPAILTTAILEDTAHTVTLEANGGTVDPSEITVDYGEAAGELPVPERTGYTFDGWYSDEELSAEFSAQAAIRADTKAYAKWTVNQYTITFDSDGGTAVDSITQDYGTAITKPSNPSKAGYTFLGWVPSVPSKIPAYDLTVTAVWAECSHSNSSKISSTDATCEEDGVTTYICNDCGYEYTETVPATGHIDENGDGICDACSKRIDGQDSSDDFGDNFTLKIKTPSATAVKFGHTLVLGITAADKLPDGYSLAWTYSGNGFDKETDDGTLTFKLTSKQKGNGTVTVKILDASGNTVKKSSGEELSDSLDVSSKVNFWYKIVYFFKKLFKLNLYIY